jgi:hypothetical protein
LAQEEEFEYTVNRNIEARVREGVAAVLEEVLQEEMTEHLKSWLSGAHAHPPRRALRPLHTEPVRPGG